MCVTSVLIFGRAVDTTAVPYFGDQDMLPQVTTLTLEGPRWRPVQCFGAAFTLVWSISI